eukprot:351033-Chlamydomonas_euryale.AAC.3
MPPQFRQRTVFGAAVLVAPVKYLGRCEVLQRAPHAAGTVDLQRQVQERVKLRRLVVHTLAPDLRAQLAAEDAVDKCCVRQVGRRLGLKALQARLVHHVEQAAQELV